MQIFVLACSLMVGLLLGGMYFGGLWWTVRRIPQSDSPALLLAASWLIRTAVLCGGLYLVMQNDWKRMAAAGLGLVIVRVITVRRLRPDVVARFPDRGPAASLKESRYGH